MYDLKRITPHNLFVVMNACVLYYNGIFYLFLLIRINCAVIEVLHCPSPLKLSHSHNRRNIIIQKYENYNIIILLCISNTII